LTSELPHVWWCLTGSLAFLPMHAAGLHHPDSATERDGTKLSDFVVSSYAPTLSALLNGSYPRAVQKHKLLTVALPTESNPKLPGTKVELDMINNHLQDYAVLELLDSRATVENVVEGMEECSWVHFACHGVQNISNPTESALFLAGDSQLTLSKITKLSFPHAELAFLSACQTAMGADDLAEEAVYLAAGMLLAGYRGVIGTMWSIQDDDGPTIANEVYGHLFKTSQPDATQAAYALHAAVEKLQKTSENKSFFHWVPYIHIGV
jgi:CHAT domain-containing protein